MMGMGEIVRWSIKDEECLHHDTRVLCKDGYKNISEVSTDDYVYQYNKKIPKELLDKGDQRAKEKLKYENNPLALED